MEFVFGSNEIFAGEVGNSLGDSYVKACGSVKTGTDGSAAECKLLKLGKSDLKQLFVLLKAGSPTRDLLREGDGRCILKMGASALYDALVFLFKSLEGGDEQVDGGNDLILDGDDRVLQILRHGGELTPDTVLVAGERGVLVAIDVVDDRRLAVFLVV